MTNSVRGGRAAPVRVGGPRKLRRLGCGLGGLLLAKKMLASGSRPCSDARMADTLEDRATLSAAGFEGFLSIGTMQNATGVGGVPDSPGVYVILREAGDPPEFLSQNPGGHFKGKDPTVPVATLREKWVDGASVLYVGRSGGDGVEGSLFTRLTDLLDFGLGRPVGHWGGRYLWQLADVQKAVICWRECRDEEPGALKDWLIDEFVQRHGKRPFANIRG